MPQGSAKAISRAAFAFCILLPAASPLHAAKAPAAHLASSPSPYLREHADNLVAWRTWGEAAFEEARRTGKPIFLSIGYSACHWCHVMEEVNFMNPQVAAFINARFIPILVDRERRPGVDETYMLATEALTGRGGWPNNLFLTPDLDPFFATGYAPASRFMRILSAIDEQWRKDAPAIRAEGRRISGILRAYLARRPSAPMLTPERLHGLIGDLLAGFDEFHGGWGSGPKHFRQPILMLLARAAQDAQGKAAREALLNTLDNVARGGVMDHIGGGFFRYAVDAQWNLPHFEKMLYTQAQMSRAFLEGWRITGRPLYARTVRRTLDYVLDDLTVPSGGFYSSRDADSSGGEGGFYVWTPEELKAVLGEEDAKFATGLFGEVAYGELAGRIVIQLQNVTGGDMARVRSILARLARARGKRTPPRRDEKIITAWNGLMITALADAARGLGEPRYKLAAIRAAAFVWNAMRAPDGTLRRSWFAGKAELPGTLADDAHMLRALIAIYDLTGDAAWLSRARELAAAMIRDFSDEKTGGFWFTRQASGFVRPMLSADGALPSAQGVALQALSRLARRTGEQTWRDRAERLAAALLGAAVKTPVQGAQTLLAADEMLRGETGALQYAASGIVRAQAVRTADNGVVVRLHVRKGWHVNAARPSDVHYVPTRLMLAAPPAARLADMRYPAPVIRKLAFSGKPLRLLEGDFAITARLKDFSGGLLDLRLDVQPCSDEICLQPQTLRLRLQTGAGK